MASLSCWGMSPCIADTVKLLLRIFSVSQSTWAQKKIFRLASKPSMMASKQKFWERKAGYEKQKYKQGTFLLVLQKITAWVMVSVS